MGLPWKRSKKAQEKSDDDDDDDEFEYDDDMDNDELSVEEEDNDEFEDEDDSNDDDNDADEEDEDEEGEEEEEEVIENGSKLNNDAEMEELEKEYTNLRNQEQDILQNLKRHKDEDILKGKAVKNQKALWDKTLEFRFLLQKAFSSSNRLPQDPIRSSFCDSDKSVNAAYSGLITSSKETLDSLLELQEALLEKNPSILNATDGKLGQVPKHLQSSNNDEDWSQISQMHARIAAFRDKSIDKWQRKTPVTTGAAAIKGKLHAFNQNISEQVAAYMRDPSRMIKQMQQRRSTVGIFGAVPAGEVNPKAEEAQADGDPELLDDSEFYQHLLKEFFETIDPTSNETAFYALKRLQTKKRKIVDRRASKGRKIRYHVQEKLVNFMAPEPMNIPPDAQTVFKDLFGLRT
ncbi:Leucine zipper-containing transcription factor [Trema orientale]|uniref:Leucine zipper-containing transcription factor n=1 Tax=Trema orientale TaxID=63057 RepID=A0A2P5FLB4_TREOI|nr:Leucine zipper-containing transcription factor [Trema orientale]